MSIITKYRLATIDYVATKQDALDYNPVPEDREINGHALNADITLTTADISDSTNRRYVSDAQRTVIQNTSGTNTGDKSLADLGGVPTTRKVNGLALSEDINIPASAIAGRPYIVGMFYPGLPGNLSILGAHIFTDAINFPLNFSNSKIESIIPTLDIDLDIKLNNVSIGTISIASSSGITTFSCETFDTSAGDILKIIAPAIADSSFGDFICSLRGTFN